MIKNLTNLRRDAHLVILATFVLVLSACSGGGGGGGAASAPSTNTGSVTVTSISPNHGIASGSTSVTITGTGFATGATVNLGSASCGSVTVVSATQITCTTAAGTSGVSDVIVTNLDTTTNTLSSGFTYYAALAISPSTKTLAVNNPFGFSETGGYGTFTYSVTSGGGSFSGATYTAPSSSGTAVVTVTDSDGNTSTANITINAALAINQTSKTLAVTNNFTFSATGGVAPYSFTSTNGAINSSTGVYTAPSSNGSATVTVTDSLGNTSHSTVTINPALAISPSSTTVAASGNASFSATGGVGSFSYSTTAGSINSSTGAFTAPSSAASVTVTVTDSLGNTSNSSVTITGPLAISPTAKTLAVNNAFTFSAAGGTSPYTYSVVTGGGGSFSGAVYTAPASAGTYTVKVTDATSATSNATVTVNAALAISPNSKTLAVNDTFSFGATGGVSPYTYSVVTGGGGSFSGTTYTAPSATGTYTVRVTDSLNNTSNGTVTINAALAIAPTAISIITGETTNFGGSGGVPSYTFSSTAGYVNSSTGAYTVPLNISPIADTVTVTDSVSNSIGTSVNVRAFQTKDAFSYSGGNPVSTSTAVDSSGNIYSVGYGASGANHWLVRKSANSGTTWTTVDDYQYTSGYHAWAYGVAIDSTNNVYVIGGGLDSSFGEHWVVRKTTNGGTSWTTVDDYRYSSDSFASGIVIDSSNNVYVAGNGITAGTIHHWLLRKSTNGGTSWTNSDDFNYGSTYGAIPTSVTIDGSSNLYVAGYGMDGASAVHHWLVRKGTSLGTSWATSETYQYAASQPSEADGIAYGSGTVYVVGFGTDGSSVEHWIVRSIGGGSWSTFDDYQAVSGQAAYASSVTVTSTGKLFVAGSAGTGVATIGGWVVRTSTPTIVDNYNYATGYGSQIKGITVDSSNKIYCVGTGQNSGGAFWISRILSP